MSQPPIDITFLDITDGKEPPTPLSPNTWKVRLALNVKKLPYKTEWVSFPAVEQTLKAYGINPTSKRPDGTPHYTLPAIIDRTADPSNPVLIADSTPIIEYLQTTYPSPSEVTGGGVNLTIPSTSERALASFMENTMLHQSLFALMYIDLFIGAVYGKGSPELQAIYGELFKKRLGKHPSELEKQGAEREEAWAKLEKSLGILAGAYGVAAAAMGEPERVKGVFIIPGSGPSAVDLRLAAWMVWMRLLRPTEAWDERVSKWHGGRWAKFFEWFEEYLTVDGRSVAF